MNSMAVSSNHNRQTSDPLLDGQPVRTKPSLAIVIIGRNAQRQLKEVQRLNSDLFVQAARIVYVDSASTDDSVGVAKGYDWQVVQLCSNGVLSAAAGRHVGAIHCREDYILFLDADMKLDLRDFTFLGKLAAMRAHGVVGVSGEIVDVFPDGATHTRHLPERPYEDLYHFGGIVILEREALLAAGNWNPNVIAHEEDELYARLKKDGGRILREPLLRCFHYTDQRGLLRALIATYIPTSQKELRAFPGIGLAFRSALQSGSWLELLKLTPEPVLTCLMAVAVTLAYPRLIVALVIILSWMLIITSRRTVAYLAVCPAKALQFLIGMLLYRTRRVTYQ